MLHSPCGEMVSAMITVAMSSKGKVAMIVAFPLRGDGVCNEEVIPMPLATVIVAFPLRGDGVCNWAIRTDRSDVLEELHSPCGEMVSAIMEPSPAC